MPVYNFEWGLIIPAVPALLRGLMLTLEVSVIAFALAMVLALPVALMRLSGQPVLVAIAYAWVQVFRSLSTYVLILFIYFGVSAVSPFKFQPFPAAVVVLTLLQSAYIAEIYRGALAALHPGQREAGLSLGMSDMRVLADIRLPQALRVALPMLVTQLCQIIKDSSVIAVIGGADLMNATMHSVEMTSHPFEFYTVTGLVYVGVIAIVGGSARVLERRLRDRIAA